MKLSQHRWLIATIILAGLNLRPALAAVSTLLDSIHGATGMDFATLSLLTTLPVVAMGACAFTAGALQQRLGAYRGMLLALAMILAANLLRALLGDAAGLLATALLAGVGIALVQVLLPGFIKQHFPGHVSQLMGLYVTAIIGGASLAATLSPWLSGVTGWQLALAFWALPALLALAMWRRHVQPEPPHADGSSVGVLQFARRPRAWLLALYFGGETGVYTCTLAWLPTFFIQLGWTPQQGGLMLGYMTGMEVLSGLLLPLLTARVHDLRPVMLGLLSAIVAGLLGMVSGAAGPMVFLWVGLLGTGIGGLFPLAMILTLNHIDEPRAAGSLAAFVQGVGYLVAAAAPFIAGWLRDVTHSLDMAWLALAGMVAVLGLMTLRFNPRRYGEAIRPRGELASATA